MNQRTSVSVRHRAIVMRLVTSNPSVWMGPMKCCRLGVRRNGTTSGDMMSGLSCLLGSPIKHDEQMISEE